MSVTIAPTILLMTCFCAIFGLMVIANEVERTELIKEIDRLPHEHAAQVFDFMKYLQQKTHKGCETEIAEYKAMAADAEREREAQEWCGSCFGPARGQ